MKTKDFDEKFDENKVDVIEYLDLSALRHPNQQQKRISINFPIWVIDSLDKEANRIGVTCQSIIKLWLVDKLESLALTRRSS